MILGRRSDFIEKMRRACAAWKRQDALLQVAFKQCGLLNGAIEAYAQHCGVLKSRAVAWKSNYEAYDDAFLVDLYELIKKRDKALKHLMLDWSGEEFKDSETEQRQIQMRF